MTDRYLFAGNAAELERLRLQARVWESNAETLLDTIGISPGARCIDLGCGGMGILGPLSRRVGKDGYVVGVENDLAQLAAARAYVQELGVTNVTIEERDAYDTDLPRAAFDLVHVRFLFAPVGRDDDLLAEMRGLVRPGGIIVIQEPDMSSWHCYPPHPAWEGLKAAISAAFTRGGGDMNVGQRTYGMLRHAGLKDVRIRAAVLALQSQHPYRRLITQFAASLRPRILADGLMSEAELDEAVAICDRLAADPEVTIITFILTQVWGYLPAQEAE